MWNSDLTEWDAFDMGPKRDVIGELEQSTRKRNMKFGASYHRERHFSYFTNSKNKIVPDQKPLPGVQKELDQNPESIGLYGPIGLTQEFMDDYKARWDELCTKYRPDIMWFDDIPSFYMSRDEPQVTRYKELLTGMVADYLNKENEWGVRLAVNNKGRREANFPEAFGIREYDYYSSDAIISRPWMDSRGMGKSYGFHKQEDDENDYPTGAELVDHMIDVVSKGGVFLLNVGPKADGTISDNQTQRLKDIGEWMAINGEAIYGTRPYKTFGYDDVRFTTKGSDLYIIWRSIPADGLVVKGINPKKGTKVIQIDGGKKAVWKLEGDQLRVIPKGKLADPNSPTSAAYAFKIKGYLNVPQ